MTFEEWWKNGGRDYLIFHPNVKVYAEKAWGAALSQARQEEREFAQQECRDAECVDVENAPVGHVSKEYLEGWNEACRWIRAQIYARSQVTP